MTGIYKITSPTGKIYIGQSVNIKRRFYAYKSSSCIDQPRIYNSFRKHGVENHSFDVVEKCSFDNLNERERYWQEFYNVIGINGLNCQLTNTDSKKIKVSEFTKQKHSLRKGENHPSFGKKRTKEQRLRMSKSQRALNKTVVFSESTRKKISERMQNNKVWVGRKHMANTKEKMSLNSANASVLLDFETGIFYNSIKEYCELTSQSYPKVYSYFAGKRKSIFKESLKIV